MVALDAIDAFDALWATAADAAIPTDSATVVDRTAAATPLDEPSLGMLDAPSLWAEEIAGDAEQQTAAAVSPMVPDAIAPRESAALEMPAWLADDHDATPSVRAPTGVVDSTRPNAGDVSSAQVAAPQYPMTPDEPIEQPAHTRFELVEESTANERAAEIGSSAMVFPPGNRHVSAALDRLAQRVRSGEIDVSSIAPEATDAAMLAFVLAALLGGSSSR
jgi:hypothetical protein